MYIYIALRNHSVRFGTIKQYMVFFQIQYNLQQQEQRKNNQRNDEDDRNIKNRQILICLYYQLNDEKSNIFKHQIPDQNNQITNQSIILIFQYKYQIFNQINKEFNYLKFYIMGIGRDSRHKRRLTGGRMPIHKKKRAFEKARPLANTKLSDKPRIRHVRVRGGNYKFRALRLKQGNFNWASEAVTRKTRILDVVYNASNNELVRTKTLVKNCIVQIDATPFKTWYNTHYGLQITTSKKAQKKEVPKQQQKRSKHVKAVLAHRQKSRVIDPRLEQQFGQQRLYAAISSRPGQSGRADGYILEGKELQFYSKKIEQRRK